MHLLGFSARVPLIISYPQKIPRNTVVKEVRESVLLHAHGTDAPTCPPLTYPLRTTSSLFRTLTCSRRFWIILEQSQSWIRGKFSCLSGIENMLLSPAFNSKKYVSMFSDGKSLRRHIEGTSFNQFYDESAVVCELDERIPKSAVEFDKEVGGIPNFMVRKGPWKLMLPKLRDSPVIDMMYHLGAS